MKTDFMAIIEPAEEGGYWAICPEVPGANGQGETVEEAKRNMAQAIKLLKDDENIETGRERNL
jgi:predicted RNase H-like HicB family nuclease